MILSRKQELTMDEIGHQNRFFRDLDGQMSHVIRVDANRGVPYVVEEILRTVMEFTNERAYRNSR